ncbi:MAG: 3-hydroxyacyl-CoA dehydrogenase NAD-binding domain-containing protein, partial [Gammaproteobacteria bacterium]
MNFKGKTLTVSMLPDGIAKLEFDLQDSSVNKFNRQTLQELQEVIARLADSDCRGLIFASAKSTFVVGADIMEFTAMFTQPQEQLLNWLKQANSLFNAIEDLPMPTVTIMDGNALGGGFELAVATDYRIATANAVVGFPEVKLGIIPGFGGTVRLPRLIGADNANQWISSGTHMDAEQAFKEGALDALVTAEDLEQAARKLIHQCNDGKLDYKAVRQRKQTPLTLQPIELSVAFETAKAMVAAKAGPNYPAPLAAVKAMQEAATLDRAGALEIEHRVFVSLARGEVAGNLVQMFINDQFLSGKARKHLAAAGPVKTAAVLGAGIMGGGIAYQSALKGTAIVMKDIAQQGLDLGMAEARKQLQKRVSRGRLAAGRVIDVLSLIRPTLGYEGFASVDLVVEAVVEKIEVKKAVLAELEDRVGEETVIATNTSTISVDMLADGLKRPEKFCGMHFFNPVPVMPLVEVIRGQHSSEQTIATTVAYAKALGKTPIVVNNCPGFLVNRILFPYFGA